MHNPPFHVQSLLCITLVGCSLQVDVMVTAGANQAFTNLVCTLLDAEDAAVLFSPYYFNHLMALQARLHPCSPVWWSAPVGRMKVRYDRTASSMQLCTSSMSIGCRPAGTSPHEHLLLNVVHLVVLPQMTGGSNDVVFGRCDPATWHPDLDWLEGAMAGPSPPRMVVLINPCNPTGMCCRSLRIV